MRRSIALISFIISLVFSSLVYGGDYETGRAAYDVGDFERAQAVWAPAAESGDADSQFGMGLLYANGYGVPLDDAQALKWYMRSPPNRIMARHSAISRSCMPTAGVYR
jgi:hypothetical protein